MELNDPQKPIRIVPYTLIAGNTSLIDPDTVADDPFWKVYFEELKTKRIYKMTGTA